MSETSNVIRSFAGSVQGLTAIIGIVANALCVYSSIYTTKTTFRMLCLVKHSINMYICCQYLLFQVPMTFGNFTYDNISMNNILTVLQNNLYISLEYIGILIAVNRFISLYFPLKFNSFDGRYVTLICLFGIFMERGWASVTHVLYACPLIYDGTLMTWNRVLSSKCNEKEFEFSGVLSLTVMTLGAGIGINILTIIKVIHFYLTNSMSSRTQSYAAINKNCKLFIQTFIQDSLFVFDLLCINNAVYLIDHPLWIFLCITLAGQLVHVLDGIIMLAYQPFKIEYKARSSKMIFTV